MEEEEYIEFMAYADFNKMTHFREDAKLLILDGKYDDAIAFAMAAGTHIGWEAHKKKVESETNNKDK